MSDEHQSADGQTTIWVITAGHGNGERVAAFWSEADARTYASVSNSDLPAIVHEISVQGDRRRCRLCGEPIVLEDPADSESWIHAPDANDLADHTAEV